MAVEQSDEASQTLVIKTQRIGQILSILRRSPEERPIDGHRAADAEAEGQKAAPRFKPTMPLDMEAIDQSMVCHASQQFTVSCGTVTINPQTSDILLIYNERLQIYQLPKGRKNIGETFLAAALRETYEETGYRVKALPLLVHTRATVPRSDRPYSKAVGQGPVQSGGSSGSVTGSGVGPRKKVEVTEDVLNTEPLAMCTYPDPQAHSPAPVMKMVFYYAATLEDAEAAPDAGTQDIHENLQALWRPVKSALELLRFCADKDVVLKAVADMRVSGYRIEPV